MKNVADCSEVQKKKEQLILGVASTESDVVCHQNSTSDLILTKTSERKRWKSLGKDFSLEKEVGFLLKNMWLSLTAILRSMPSVASERGRESDGKGYLADQIIS